MRRVEPTDGFEYKPSSLSSKRLASLSEGRFSTKHNPLNSFRIDPMVIIKIHKPGHPIMRAVWLGSPERENRKIEMPPPRAFGVPALVCAVGFGWQSMEKKKGMYVMYAGGGAPNLGSRDRLARD